MKPALAYCRLRLCRSQYWFFYIISFSVHFVFSSVNRNFQIIALMLIFWLSWVKMNLISKWSNPSTEKEVTFIEFWSRWQTRLRPFHQALLWNAPKPATVCMEQKKLARVIWWCLARCYRKRSNPLHRKYRSLQRERPQNGISYFTIVDGQQRIISLTIFLASVAFCLHCYEFDDEFRGTKQYLFTRDDLNQEAMVIKSEQYIALERIITGLFSISPNMAKCFETAALVKQFSRNNKNLAAAFVFFIKQHL